MHGTEPPRVYSKNQKIRAAIERFLRSLDEAGADTGHGKFGIVVTLKNRTIHEIEYINNPTERHHATGT